MIPLILNIARLATTVAMAESRAAALNMVRAQAVSTGRSLVVGEVLKNLGGSGKWSGTIRRAKDSTTGDTFVLFDASLAGVSDLMSDRDVAALDSLYEVAGFEGLPARASLSLENLNPGEVSRLLRSVRDAEDESGGVSTGVVQASSALLVYTVAQAGALALAGAAVGAVLAGATANEWAKLRSLTDPDTFRRLRGYASKATAGGQVPLSASAADLPYATSLAGIAAIARDPGLRAKAAGAMPPHLRDEASAYLATVARSTEGLDPRRLDMREGLSMLESVRSAVPPAVLLGLAAMGAPLVASDAEDGTSKPAVVRIRDLTTAGLAATGLWNPKRVVKGFGARPHKGADIPVRVGTTVLAIASGVVRWLRFDTKGGGHSMDVLYDEVNGRGPCLITYRHLSKFLLAEGARFVKGDSLCLSGNTGSSTTGSHLHVELRLVRDAYASNKQAIEAKVPSAAWQVVPVESLLPNV